MAPSEEITAVALELFRIFLRHVLPEKPAGFWNVDANVRQLWENLNPSERTAWLAIADYAQTIGVH